MIKLLWADFKDKKIHSLATLRYHVRNYDVSWFLFFFLCTSAGLQTAYCCGTWALRSDAIPDTSLISWTSNTGPLDRKTHALPIASRTLPYWITYRNNFRSINFSYSMIWFIPCVLVSQLHLVRYGGVCHTKSDLFTVPN